MNPNTHNTRDVVALDESALLQGNYPTRWEDYVGQDVAKRQLRNMSKSARVRGDRLPHILISSPYAGIGKTALMLLVARTYGAPVVQVSGRMTVKQAMDVLEDMEDGDVLLYDEFHQIATGGAANQEWLLHYLENGVLLMPWGPEIVPKVTLVAATTDPHMLLVPVKDRFTHVQLKPYTDVEGAQIAMGLAGKILAAARLPQLHPDTALEVAVAGANQPRTMRRLIESIRDLAICEEIPVPEDGRYRMGEALDFAGLTYDGLTAEAVDYMVLMKTELRREAASEQLLKSRLGYKRGNGLMLVELLLVSRGYIALTKQGRMLTAAGSRRAKELIALAEDEQGEVA